MGPESGRQRGNGWPWIGIGLMSIMAFGGLMTVTEKLGPASIPIWFMALGAGALVLRGPIGKAIGRRFTGELPAAGPTELPEELYAELDELRARMLELEERQDFSERLLATRDAAPTTE